MTTISPAMRVLMASVRADIPVILWDEPGTGKTAVIESMFEAAGYHVETIIASHRDPSEMNGLPFVYENTVKQAPNEWVTRVNSMEKAVVFLDETTTAAPAVQAATLRMINERWVGDVRLGDHVRFVLAANPPECAAGGFELSAPTANRLMHISWSGLAAEDFAHGLVFGFDSVTPDFASEGIVEASEERMKLRASVVGSYVMRNPALIHALPNDPAAAGKAWPSRRTWHMLARVLPFIDDADTEGIMLAANGCVGEGAGTEFAVWVANADLPDPREVLNDPTAYDFTDERLDRTFVLLSSVAALASQDGTKESWLAAWAVLGEAAKAKRTDLAAGAARALASQKKAGWMPPKSAIVEFIPMLKKAGLMGEMKAAA